jgi:transposase
MINKITNEKKFARFVCAYLKKNYYDKFYKANKNRNKDYTPKLIIMEIIRFVRCSSSYENFGGPINSKTLNGYVLFFAKNKIFEIVYNDIYLPKYMLKYKEKLKILSIDTSFIINKNGKNKISRTKIANNIKHKRKKKFKRMSKNDYKNYNSKLILGKNKMCKNKNCYKFSSIVDENQVTISAFLSNGSISDSVIGKYQIENFKNPIENAIILADKGYDSNEFRNQCKNANLNPIIDYNNRNTQDPKKIKKLTKKEKIIYKKRIVVENSYCKLKKFRRLNLVYDSYKSTFNSFIHLALCLNILKHL